MSEPHSGKPRGHGPEPAEAAAGRPAGLLGGLEREHGCLGNLQWRCDLACGSDWEALFRGLGELGYRLRCRLPFLVNLRHPEEHEIVVVPATGRVQLRVHYLTEAPRREAVARRLFSDLERSADTSAWPG
jgi:hypothetical protein